MVTSSSSGAAMSLQAIQETIRKPSAAIDSERWPAVAKVPSGPVAAASAVIAGRLLRRAAARLPLRLVYPDGDGDRRRRPDVTDPGDPPAGRAGTPDRAARPDRLRRVLHGRRMVVERPHRGVDGAGRIGGRPGAQHAAMAAADRRRPFDRVGEAPAEIRRGATSPSTMTCRTTCSPSSSTRP